MALSSALERISSILQLIKLARKCLSSASARAAGSLASLQVPPSDGLLGFGSEHKDCLSEPPLAF